MVAVAVARAELEMVTSSAYFRLHLESGEAPRYIPAVIQRQPAPARECSLLDRTADVSPDPATGPRRAPHPELPRATRERLTVLDGALISLNSALAVRRRLVAELDLLDAQERDVIARVRELLEVAP